MHRIHRWTPKSSIRIASLILLLALSVTLSAQGLVVDRGLPIGNQRAGVRLGWTKDKTEFLGDDFHVGASGETWLIDKIRVWAVVPGSGHSENMGDLFSTISLYGGLASDPITDDKARDADCDCHGLVALKSATLPQGKSDSGNKDISISPVNTRSEALREVRGVGGSLWQIDFQNLQWSVPGGVGIEFGVRGEAREASSKNSGPFWFSYGSAIRDSHRLKVFDRRRLPKAFFDGGKQMGDATIGINVQVWARRRPGTP